MHSRLVRSRSLLVAVTALVGLSISGCSTTLADVIPAGSLSVDSPGQHDVDVASSVALLETLPVKGVLRKLVTAEISSVRHGLMMSMWSSGMTGAIRAIICWLRG